MKTLINADCLGFLKETEETWDCGFADIPDNLGLPYDYYADNQKNYYDWVELFLRLAIPRCRVLWLSFYHAHLLELSYRIKTIREYPRLVRCFPWRFKFGRYGEKDAPNGWRPIFRIATLYWKPRMVERIPSVREEMGDPRASGKGRVPDDVFEECRIQGNNKERRSWCPTQMPEAIYRRIAKMSVDPGGSFIDFFGGTGTAFRAINHCDTTVVELSPRYCQEISNEHQVPII